ncbi:MAG: hypothetical protein WD708_12100 [Kiritimatiellia bacterium]
MNVKLQTHKVTSAIILLVLFLFGVFYIVKMPTTPSPKPPVVADEYFGTTWLEKISERQTKARLTQLLSKLKKQKWVEGGDLQTEFFKTLYNLSPKLHQMNESYLLQKTPPDESIHALDDILGEGASAEFLAQWLYRVDCGESGMRSYPDVHVRKLLVEQGSAALPALHRVLSIPNPDHLEMYDRYRWFVYGAIADIGQVDSIPLYIADIRADKDGAANGMLTSLLVNCGYESIPYILQHLNDPNRYVQTSCYEAFRHLTGQTIPSPGKQLNENTMKQLSVWWEENRSVYEALP